MYGWYSENDARTKGIVYIYKDINGTKSMITYITEGNECPYEEESTFGSDCISIGKVTEYVDTKEYKLKNKNLISTYEYISKEGN